MAVTETKLREAFIKEVSAHVQVNEGRLAECAARLVIAERRIQGLMDELSKTNERIDSMTADRDAARKDFDRRHAEIVQAYEDAESAFTERLAQMAELNMGQKKHMANMKQKIAMLEGDHK